MAKRGADNYLTDQNWDQEDTDRADEEPGTFCKADEEVLKNRVIRKAKRRTPQGQMSAVAALSGFSGFKTSINQNANSGGMHGNGAFTAQATGFSRQTAGQTGFSCQTGQRGFQQLKFNSIPCSTGQDDQAVPSISKSSDEEESTKNIKEYNRHLIALNKSVSNWIKNHVEKNPLCDLTPIFLDYNKFLLGIEEKFGISDSEGSSSSSTETSDSQETADTKSSQDSSQTSQEFSVSEKPKLTFVGFRPKPDTTTEDLSKVQESPSAEPQESPSVETPTNKSLFSGFQTTSSAFKASPSPFKGFNTEASVKGSAFAGLSFRSSMVGDGNQNSESAEQQSSGQNAEEEEYVPPKPESNVLVEEDAFFTIRCKLYYKKEEAFVDRGIGQLYLKPSGSKTQLLIRADTAISQILLNIILASSIPIKKQGKNNILIMCIPNPPINEHDKDKVMPLLIRVKTSEDADSLLEAMEQKKREAAQAES